MELFRLECYCVLVYIYCYVIFYTSCMRFLVFLNLSHLENYCVLLYIYCYVLVYTFVHEVPSVLELVPLGVLRPVLRVVFVPGYRKNYKYSQTIQRTAMKKLFGEHYFNEHNIWVNC